VTLSALMSADPITPPLWNPRRPRFNLLHVIVSWLCAAVAVFVAGLIVPGVTVVTFFDALVAAVLLAVLNAVLPAACRGASPPVHARDRLRARARRRRGGAAARVGD
jgi:hypothetical protein